MRIMTAAAILLATISAVEAGPSKYDTTPLTAADVDFYLSIKRAGADCVTHATGADKDALDIMRRNHGVLTIPAMPQIKGNPTPAQLADLQKNMAAISAQAARNGAIQGRASALAMCDEMVAEKRGQKAHYDEIRAVVEAAVPMLGDIAGSCGGGGGCAPENPTPAQLALWKREAEVFTADRALLKPHAEEIRRLQKTLMSAMGL